jgi:hypothetical protein
LISLRKDCERFQDDVEKIGTLKEDMSADVSFEAESIDYAREKLQQLKKAILDTQREKEKLVILVKNDQKQVQNLEKRKQTL